MKKTYPFLFLPLVWAGLCLAGCKGDEHASVYKAGRVWHYDVSVQDSTGSVVDTFQLKMKTRPSSFAEKVIRGITVEYEYLRNGTLFNSETTGIEDNAERITIHPPRDSYFDIAEIVHFPFITKPIGMGFSASSDFAIQKASYANRVTNEKINLAGKKIKQEIKLVDSTTVSLMNEPLKCYVIEGKNVNYLDELGQFSGTFYFNEKYGFVKLAYFTPWKSIVSADLKHVDF